MFVKSSFIVETFSTHPPLPTLVRLRPLRVIPRLNFRPLSGYFRARSAPTNEFFESSFRTMSKGTIAKRDVFKGASRGVVSVTLLILEPAENSKANE